MNNSRMRTQTDFVEHVTNLNEMTPLRHPAAMPRQTIVFWTPRLAVTAMAGALKELRRLPRATRPATVSISKFDATR